MAAPLDTPDPHLSPEVAARYDTSHADRFRPDAVDPAVDLLAGYAGGAPAVEFAIGTGRLAVPLAQRGVEVSGMDISQTCGVRPSRSRASATRPPTCDRAVGSWWRSWCRRWPS